MPASITGRAKGSCTFRSICSGVIPIPFAASTTAASTSFIPIYVLRIIGNKAYRNNAAMAGNTPMPSKGIKKPKSAMEGIVCKIPAKPNTVPANLCLRAIATPKGSPIKTAIKRAIKVSPI